MTSAPEKSRRRRLPLTAASLRTLYDASPIGIAELDDDGRFTSANPALRRMLGRSEDELRRLTFNDVTHPDDLGECVREFERLVRREIGHFEIEKRFLPKPGGIVWAHTVVTAVRSGRRSSMIGMAVDVTERRLAQDELARLKAELDERIKDRTAALSYQSALLTAERDCSPDGFLVVDAGGRIVSRNKRFGELWGIPEAVLAKGSDEEALESVLVKLADPEAFIERVRRLYRHREEKSFDELVLADGRVFERYSSPVLGDGGRYYGRVWYFRDITERALHDAEIREKTEALARSNSELEMYAYAASHDLSAPLRKIIAFGDLLEGRAKGKLEAAELDYLERMRKSAASAMKLVSDMLTLSRVGREPLMIEELDLNSILAEVKAELAAELDGARIEAEPLPALRAHPALIHGLLLNLISNALKFRRPDRAPVVRVGSRRDGGDVLITVADDGIGFDREYAEKIFRPFLRLHTAAEFEGSGIGLAICRRVVLRYGGSITADSAPGEGSTFTVRLPASMLAR